MTNAADVLVCVCPVLRFTSMCSSINVSPNFFTFSFIFYAKY